MKRKWIYNFIIIALAIGIIIINEFYDRYKSIGYLLIVFLVVISINKGREKS